MSKILPTPYGWWPDEDIYTSTYNPTRRKDLVEVSRNEYVVIYKNKHTGEIHKVERRKWIGKGIRRTKDKIRKQLRKLLIYNIQSNY